VKSARGDRACLGKGCNGSWRPVCLFSPSDWRHEIFENASAKEDLGSMPHRIKQHRPPRGPKQSENRPSFAKRGYGRRWQKLRQWFLIQPENVLCACGCGRQAEVVDHIEPVSGPDDPRFFDPDNLQALTAACHNRKTAKDRTLKT
jgi:hypothetical protein